MPSFSRFLRAIEWICLEIFVLSLKIKKSHDGCLYLDLLVGVGLPSAPPRNLWKEKRLTWKDWVPTFILAPLIFPFFLIMEKHGEASFGLGHKDEPTKKKKKK